MVEWLRAGQPGMESRTNRTPPCQLSVVSCQLSKVGRGSCHRRDWRGAVQPVATGDEAQHSEPSATPRRATPRHATPRGVRCDANDTANFNNEASCSFREGAIGTGTTLALASKCDVLLQASL